MNLLIHNHPDAVLRFKDMMASGEDLEATENLCRTCNVPGLSCLDSIVAGIVPKHGKELVSYHSIKQGKGYSLKDDALKSKAAFTTITDMNSIGAHCCLPIFRLALRTRKYASATPFNAPKTVQEYIAKYCLSHRKSLDLLILLSSPESVCSATQTSLFLFTRSLIRNPSGFTGNPAKPC